MTGILATNATLVAPALGVPTSGTLTNCTGLPEAGLTIPTLTYTPTLAFATPGSGVTYSTQTGHYIKIGGLVCFSCKITISAVGSGTGNAFINLPGVNPPLDAEVSFSIITANITYGAGSPIAIWSAPSSAVAIGFQISPTGYASLTHTAFTAGSSIIVTGTFLV